MGKYRSLGTWFDRIFRNDLNANFDDIGKDINNVQSQVNRLVVSGDSSPQAAQASVGADGTDYGGNLKARLDADYNEVTTQLATTDEEIASLDLRKAETSYVDTMINAVSGINPKGVFPTLSALQTAYPNGTPGYFLILENNHLYIWNQTTWQDIGKFLDSTEYFQEKIDDANQLMYLNSKRLGKKPTFYPQGAQTTQYNYDEVTGITNVVVGDTADGSFLRIFDYIDSIGTPAEKLNSGDIVEIILVYKTNQPSGKDSRIQIRLDDDSTNIRSFSLIADNKYHTYKMQLVVGTDVNSEIRFQAQYGTANLNDSILQYYVRKYNVKTAYSDLAKENLYYYLMQTLGEPQKGLNGVSRSSAGALIREIESKSVDVLKDLPLKKPGKKPTYYPQSAGYTEFTYNEQTGSTKIKVGSQGDNAYLQVFEYANSIGRKGHSLVNGDVIEVTLIYKTNNANNKLTIRRDNDVNKEIAVPLTPDGEEHTYKYYYTVGTDLITSIRFQAQFTGVSANTDAELIQFYADKYVPDEKIINQLREAFFDFLSEKYAYLDGITRNVLEVSLDFTPATEGWGISKFNSLIDAHNSISNSSYTNQYTILVYPGTYNDWKDKWSVADGESEAWKGIEPKSYVYFISTNPERPQDYILNWDGHEGLADEKLLTSTQASTRALFHINSGNNQNTGVKGFTLRARNNRYAFHAESSHQGRDKEWYLENCIIDWQGCPNTEGQQTNPGTAVGIGISAGEKGRIKNCKWLGDPNVKAIAGHNNGWGTGEHNGWDASTKPFVVPGAELLVENCDFNGQEIRMDTFRNDADTFDVLHLINCKNIRKGWFSFQSAATVQNWRANIVATQITEDLFEK